MTNNCAVAFLPAYLMSTSYILRLYIPPNLKVKIGPTNRYAYCRTDLCINYSIPYGSAFSLLDYAGRINWAHLVKCRQHRNGIFIPFRLFQSTSSVWRTTAVIAVKVAVLDGFQSTSSVRRTTQRAGSVCTCGAVFQSTSSVRRTTSPRFTLSNRHNIFQSTSSVWRTTGF